MLRLKFWKISEKYLSAKGEGSDVAKSKYTDLDTIRNKLKYIIVGISTKNKFYVSITLNIFIVELSESLTIYPFFLGMIN